MPALLGLAGPIPIGLSIHLQKAAPAPITSLKKAKSAAA